MNDESSIRIDNARNALGRAHDYLTPNDVYAWRTLQLSLIILIYEHTCCDNVKQQAAIDCGV